MLRSAWLCRCPDPASSSGLEEMKFRLKFSPSTERCSHAVGNRNLKVPSAFTKDLHGDWIDGLEIKALIYNKISQLRLGWGGGGRELQGCAVGSRLAL